MKQRTAPFTDAELALIAATRDDWMSIGLSTEPIDRAAAEAAIRDVYRTADIDPPDVWIWMTSPLGVAFAGGLLGTGQLRGQLRGQLGGQLWGQLWGQLGDQLGGQLRGQLWDQLWGQLWDQLGDQLGGQLWDQLGDQLGDQLRGQLWDQLRGQLWDQLGDQLGDQLWGQLGGQLWGQLGGQLWGQLGGQLWGRAYELAWKQIWGAWEAYWFAFYDIGFTVTADTKLRPRLDAMIAAARSCGTWQPYRNAVIVGDRPNLIRRDPQGRLHNPNGPAISYTDGWQIHAWHGIRVPDWVIAEPTLERIAAEANTETRRCAIESFGWDRYLAALGVAPIDEAPDPGNPGQTLTLYEPPEKHQPYDTPIRLLVMSNASLDRDGSRRRFAETVPVDMPDALSAAAWQFGVDRAVYAQLERAT